MEWIVQVAQLLLALSLLVGLHEAGHMIAARIFGIKVEKFFIGFPPKIFGFKKGDTEYGLGAIPLGGFVKISGMIDESLDTDQMKSEPKPWEFRSKPAWQRLIVMLGGIFVNVVVGIVAMIMVTYSAGRSYISADFPKQDGIVAGEFAVDMGFQTGDRIVDIKGNDYTMFRDLTSPDLFLGGGYYTVVRDGKQLQLEIPSGMLSNLEDPEFSEKFVSPRRPFSITFGGLEQSNAREAGLKEEDRIVKIGDKPIEFYDQVKPALLQYAGAVAPVTVLRDGEEIDFQVPTDEEGRLGFFHVSLLEVTKEDFTLMEALTVGSQDVFGPVITNFKALGGMFSGDVSVSSLKGPIGIYKLFPPTWDWHKFWRITAIISMILAFMNLLPIPALDGGHVAFLLFEMISGKAPSDAFLENAQKVGMVTLLGLMLFVFGNDIFQLFTG